ncbi:MAG: hypothetical protein UU93_C0006G0022 [Candidatus Amesbacteria bacterium GW2011_GWA2_42_12]|uniref:Nucleotidyl transferase AbiEii/AbiGii toxin family protein n=1 Tax=Candidatus Amesbacteria bacterium GW2011_GWA2_42_12 TaxID=1618356 RepID=A0A0G1B4S3_9BACT|nr:MAG: hypothetical protein UU93_C0006G0022 [Candidatus Amesbacteria bacterium GW2011_GWA2_42_12]
MFNKAILPDTFRAIQLVSKIPFMKKAYLAGGTALAMQLGHRVSVDLDFFTLKEFDEDALSAQLLRFKDFVQKNKAWGTVQGKIGQTEFSLFYYKNILIEEVIEYEGINLVSKKDIAAMKIDAIQGRGTKRDFVDVYFLSKLYKLEEMFNFYDLKYGILEDRWYSILRSLDYFEEADREDMPKMLVKVEWEEVKRFFHNESMRLAHLRPDLF